MIEQYLGGRRKLTKKQYSEQSILKKLERTHRRLYEDYLKRQTTLGKHIGHTRNRIGYQGIRNKSYEPPSAFRVDAPPIFHVYLDHAVSRFRRKSKDYFNKLEIFVDKGYLPCYSPSFDIFSVVHLYGERSSIAEKDSSLPEDVWEVTESRNTRATYSSINSFLVQKDYVDSTYSQFTDLTKQYLKQFYWSYPCKGFTCSPQIIPDRNRIRFIYKTTKTLFSFQNLTKKTLYIKGRNETFTAARLKGLIKSFGKFKVQDLTAICLPETANKLRKMDRKYVINGIVTEFIRPNLEPFYTLILASDLVDTYPHLLSAAFGMVSTDCFYRGDSIVSIGELDNLKRRAEELIDIFGNYVTLPRTVSSGIEDPWNWALKRLEPIFTVDSGTVLCLHPLFASLLQMEGMSSLDLWNKSTRILLLKALQKAFDMYEHYDSIEEVKDLTRMGVTISDLGKLFRSYSVYIPFVKSLRNVY